MRKLCFIFVAILSYVFCSAQNMSIVNSYEKYYELSTIELPFISQEILEIYKSDSTIVHSHFIKNRQSKELNSVDLYMNDICAKVLKDSLTKCANDVNPIEFLRLKTFLGNNEPLKPNVNWGGVFQVCDECPFGDMPLDVRWNVKFSLVYMSQTEIEQMIAFENGEQWNYILNDIKLGDYFGFRNIVEIEINRRIITYLIQKWSPCQIPEVQQLVSVLKEVLPMEYKDEWYEAITGKWRGKFGEKTIEVTIDANEFEINGFSKFEGQPDEKRITFYGDEYQQVEGPYVCFTVTEQPTDKEWNGKFYCRLVRNTGKMEGTWTSNNRKLERAFVLERVDK